MKVLHSKNIFQFITVSIFAIVLVLFSITIQAGHKPLANLRGPAFSDPSRQMPMPEAWQNQPIKYKPSSADADLVVSLDGQMYHVWEPLIHNYAKKHGIKIYVGKGTCGVSSGGLSQKTVDSGVFCCPPDYTDRLPGLQFHTIGIAAVALIVHPDNPIDNVTLEQARQIFQGKIRNWSEINGSRTSRLVQPVGRLHCKSRPGHWRLLLDNKDQFSPDLFEVGAIPDMIAQVAISPGAIGHETLWMMQYYQDKGKVKSLKINGYSPADPSNVSSLRYPLYRVFSFTTWEGKNVQKPHAKQLVNYIMQETERLDSKFAFIPSSELRKAGWKFRGDELIGEPK